MPKKTSKKHDNVLLAQLVATQDAEVKKMKAELLKISKLLDRFGVAKRSQTKPPKPKRNSR